MNDGWIKCWSYPHRNRIARTRTNVTRQRRDGARLECTFDSSAVARCYSVCGPAVAIQARVHPLKKRRKEHEFTSSSHARKRVQSYSLDLRIVYFVIQCRFSDWLLLAARRIHARKSADVRGSSGSASPILLGAIRTHVVVQSGSGRCHLHRDEFQPGERCSRWIPVSALPGGHEWTHRRDEFVRCFGHYKI